MDAGLRYGNQHKPITPLLLREQVWPNTNTLRRRCYISRNKCDQALCSATTKVESASLCSATTQVKTAKAG